MRTEKKTLMILSARKSKADGSGLRRYDGADVVDVAFTEELQAEPEGQRKAAKDGEVYGP